MRSLSHSFVSLAFVLAAVHAGPIRKRAEGDPMGVQDGGEATFYDIGLGACGVTNVRLPASPTAARDADCCSRATT